MLLYNKGYILMEVCMEDVASRSHLLYHDLAQLMAIVLPLHWLHALLTTLSAFVYMCDTWLYTYIFLFLLQMIWAIQRRQLYY